MSDEDGRSLRRWRRRFEGILGVPATEGNSVDVLRNGEEIFRAMLSAMREATETIDLLTYVYWKGDIAQAFAETLTERAQAGVRVRILLDAMGAATMKRQLIHDMEEAGCIVEWFRPPTTWKVWENDHRTHRKVLICDEDVAFTGGVGIAAEWEGDARSPDEWRDTHLRLRGPAVDGLRAAFLANWRETGQPLFDERDRFPEQPQPGDTVVQVVRCPAQTGWTDLATLFEALIESAQRRIRVASAYFVPDDTFRDKLCAAVRRGVRVEVLVPGTHADKRVVQLAGEELYETLLEAGVSIHTYERTMLHCKVMTVDGLVATVGSGNFDQRSMRLNEECNVVLFDEEMTRILDEHFDEDLGNSERLDLGSWRDRSLLQKAMENVTELFDHKL